MIGQILSNAIILGYKLVDVWQHLILLDYLMPNLVIYVWFVRG